MNTGARKYLSLFLMMCLVITMLPLESAFAATKSNSDNAAITKAQVCEQMNALFGATVESKKMDEIVNYTKSNKYYSTMSIAYNAGFLKPYEEGKLCKATAKANYNFVSIIFSRILNVSKKKVIGKHNPDDTMTMAEFKAYLSEFIPTVISKNTSKKEYKGNVLVNKPDVRLSNVTVKGNLIIGDGVADKEVTLNNVKVTGKLIVRGGGENSVIIMGSSDISTLVINQVNNAVSIKVSGDANVTLVYINDGSNDVILNGSFGTINVNGSDINVTADNAAISDIVLNGSNTSLNVTEGSKVSNIAVANTADNAVVDIAGSVEKVSTQAPNSAIAVKENAMVAAIVADEAAIGTKIEVLAGASVNEIISDAEETVVTGDGKVETVTISSDNSKILTADTKVVVVPKPTPEPTNKPTVKPTATPTPTKAPTATPTKVPTTKPTVTTAPTTVPTTAPVATPEPTTAPTSTPVAAPEPTSAPTSTPTPTPEPTATPTPIPAEKYRTDDRFETGYPQIVLGTQDGSGNNVKLSVKLKEGIASEASPATVYYIVSSYNTTWDVTSESVIHGHLGETIINDTNIIHNTIYCEYNGAVKITNSDAIELPFSFYDVNRDIVVYFVIKTDAYTSEVPTKILLESDTVISFTDNAAPYVMETFWSNESAAAAGRKQRVVRLLVNEAIDPDSITAVALDSITNVVSGSAINVVSGDVLRITGIDGAYITDVKGNKTLENYNCIDITINYPDGADFSNSGNFAIEYNPTDTIAFSDIANIPNKMYSFTLHRNSNISSGRSYFINEPAPDITKIYVSDDGKYLGIVIKPIIAASIFNFKVSVNGELWRINGYSRYSENRSACK